MALATVGVASKACARDDTTSAGGNAKVDGGDECIDEPTEPPSVTAAFMGLPRRYGAQESTVRETFAWVGQSRLRYELFPQSFNERRSVVQQHWTTVGKGGFPFETFTSAK